MDKSERKHRTQKTHKSEDHLLGSNRRHLHVMDRMKSVLKIRKRLDVRSPKEMGWRRLFEPLRIETSCVVETEFPVLNRAVMPSSVHDTHQAKKRCKYE